MSLKLCNAKINTFMQLTTAVVQVHFSSLRGCRIATSLYTCNPLITWFSQLKTVSILKFVELHKF